MPIVVAKVDPTDYGQPVVSMDGGVLTITPGLFGNVCKVDFSKHASDTSAALWTSVTRTVGGKPFGFVRGLDDYPSIGAMTVGVDHEAPEGTPVTYTATARAVNGTVWSSTSCVVLLTPHRNRAWLKSLTTPSLSVHLTGQSYPDWSRDIPTGVFRPPLRRDPIVRQGLRQMGTGTLTLHALTGTEIATLNALLLAGGPYLLQADLFNRANRPDVYVAVQADAMSQPYGDPDYRSWALPLIELPRPSTKGSRVALPGHTFDDAAARYGAQDNYPRPLIRLLTE